MKRHVEEKELPYFAATLTAYLRESHPELLPDKHFIAERSDHAAQTYERAVRNGNSVYEALELSNAVLYQDLRFSKYDAIFEVVSEWFPEVAARQRTAFCLKLLPVCEEVFEMYDLTDDFESSPSYKKSSIGTHRTHPNPHRTAWHTIKGNIWRRTSPPCVSLSHHLRDLLRSSETLWLRTAASER